MSKNEINQQIISFQDKLRGMALKLTRNVEDAQDLLHDTLLKAFTNTEKFTEKTNLAGWLFTIMKNTFINNYRRKKKSNTIFDESEESYYLNIPVNKGSISPESEFAFNELNKGIENLEEEFRNPFKMHLQGFKYKEIAREIKVPIGTVKSRIFQARQLLSNKFGDYK
ncbi:MAG: sigma-70 family RNA polymerase sigma factor [Bacteroidota bacterium]